jgi:hypothetical protein
MRWPRIVTTTMRKRMSKDQVPKIRIDRHQYPFFSKSAYERSRIRRRPAFLLNQSMMRQETQRLGRSGHAEGVNRLLTRWRRLTLRPHRVPQFELCRISRLFPPYGVSVVVNQSTAPSGQHYMDITPPVARGCAHNATVASGVTPPPAALARALPNEPAGAPAAALRSQRRPAAGPWEPPRD